MKHELSAKPEIFKEAWDGQYNIISWMEFVCSVPQAISVITTLKENGIPNACLQAWTMYAGDGGGYYVIFSMLNNNHTTKNILRDKEFAVNFPDAAIFQNCSKSIENNADDTDEIAASGLTAEPSVIISVPRIKECFLNLECRLSWEKPLHEGSMWHVFAGEVLHVAIDRERAREGEYSRTGPGGYIYNIHSPTDPETGAEDVSMVGEINPVMRMGQ